MVDQQAVQLGKSPVPTKEPVERVGQMMMGITISVAGKPSRKAMRITPSNPINRAKGPETRHRGREGSPHPKSGWPLAR